MPIPQMQNLREKLIAYARLVEEMIARSRTALIQGQPDLLAVVIEEDEPHANAFEVELEEEGIAVIARHQPMARELRTLLMILRITKDLERIADHAVNIAESARDFLGEQHPCLDEVRRMFDAAIDMVDCAIRSFIDSDTTLGQRVCESDEGVDALATAILERTSTVMAANPAGVRQSLAVLKVAGNLERIADLATNIGEDVIYMEEGRVIKHHHEEDE